MLSAVIGFSVIRTLPWIPRVITVSEDDSWDLMLNLFAKRGAMSGVDYIFTFGPLGFIYNKTYFPDTYALKLLLQGSLCALTTLVMVRQGRQFFSRWPHLLAWIFCLVSLYGFFGDVFFLAIPVLLVNQYFLLDDPKTIYKFKASTDTLLLVALLALTALVKFTFFVAATWVIAFIALNELLRKKLPILLFLFILVFVAGWTLSGQALANLPTYISTSLAVAAGHSEAMSWSDTNWQTPIVATIASTGLLLVSFAYLAKKRMGKSFPVALLAESGLFF